jgi:hypothetical protein
MADASVGGLGGAFHMNTRIIAHLLAAFVLAAPITAGCAAETADETTEDDGSAISSKKYEIAFDKFNAQFRGNASTPAEAFSVKVKVGNQEIVAPTHLFGDTVNIIPYSNDDNVEAADGTKFARGDQAIAQVYKPGEVGIAVKHHRSANPTLELTGGSPSAIKEHLKLQDTHIEVVVGVKEGSSNRAITLNNPQTYENGYFGTPDYPMVFLKPVYPSYLSAAQKKAFEANVRTMLLGFNAVTNFPGDYNGGDPLGARNPEKVREYVKQMVLAITGDAAAQAWFKAPENKVYCAELAFLAYSAGLIVPLNDATMVPLVGQGPWGKFKEVLEKQAKGERNPLVDMNDNTRVALVREVSVAPADLKPAESYSGATTLSKLALTPMTMSDIIEQFLRTHVPREKLGEELAPAQAALLQAMKPAVLEQMGMDSLPASDPKRVAVEQLFDQIVKVTGTKYANYTKAREALAPLLDQARKITGPRGDTGTGLFVPPSLFHVAAQGKQAGLISFNYAGHGVHVHHVKTSASR